MGRRPLRQRRPGWALQSFDEQFARLRRRSDGGGFPSLETGLHAPVGARQGMKLSAEASGRDRPCVALGHRAAAVSRLRAARAAGADAAGAPPRRGTGTEGTSVSWRGYRRWSRADRPTEEACSCSDTDCLLAERPGPEQHSRSRPFEIVCSGSLQRCRRREIPPTRRTDLGPVVLRMPGMHVGAAAGADVTGLQMSRQIDSRTRRLWKHAGGTGRLFGKHGLARN